MSKRRIETSVSGASKEEGSFEGYKSKSLHYASWKKSDNPKWALILIHGLGDHSGHMMTVVEHFLNSYPDVVVFGYDQRGHGLTEGARGHINSWQEFRGDLKCFLDFVQKKEPSVSSVILFGNSMGGAVVIDFAMNEKHHLLKGVMANGPALAMYDISSFIGFVANVVSTVAPGMTNTAPLESFKLTRDTEKQKENDEDELVHTTFSMKLLSEIHNTGKFVKSHPNLFTLPLFVVAGEKDPIVNTGEVKKFVESVKKFNQDAKIIVTDGGMHETFNDIDRKDVFAQMDQFVTPLIADSSDPKSKL
eukprot:TRINITY_DN33858_c0_g1_i1.p1 TRINITY_DN33858_c0_g1~~TRINITY_DN33858_c0_g1_i1.p1  ORF type:complete len:305 (-),score=73.67 TRINITY_DN33858_c0_g1_i1:15-929(-)